MREKDKIFFFQECIAEYFGEDPHVIVRKVQTIPVPLMKKILCYVLGIKLDMEVVRIAKAVYAFNPDHSNVYNALKSLNEDIRKKPAIKQAVNDILKSIEEKQQVPS